MQVLASKLKNISASGIDDTNEDTSDSILPSSSNDEYDFWLSKYV